jgi:acylglycerol lipase
MIEPQARRHVATDGYPIHVLSWKPEGPVRGRVVVIHGVQSHAGWYHRLGRTLAESGYEAHFPDRRGSGANRLDRGHAPSAKRLVSDVVEWLGVLREEGPPRPIALAGISWGGKIAILAAGQRPERIEALALICPGLHPRVGVPLREKLAIAIAWFVNRRKTFAIPLSDPALFTASPEGQAFIVSDPLGLRAGTAGLMAASTFLDRRVRRIPPRVRPPVLLMLAGRDRIVDNDRTRAYVDTLASADRRTIEYPEAHHTLEFEPDPSLYARDLIGWLDEVFAAREAMPGPVSR